MRLRSRAGAEAVVEVLEGEDVMSKWVDYKPGDYEKKFYDIKTMAKNTYMGCWPNAGRFTYFGDKGENVNIDEHFVVKVRLSRINDIGMPERDLPND